MSNLPAELVNAIVALVAALLGWLARKKFTGERK